MTLSSAVGKLHSHPHTARDESNTSLSSISEYARARGRSVALAMAARSFIAMVRRKMHFAGYTLVLDDNWASRRTALSLGGHVTGNFVTYRRDL